MNQDELNKVLKKHQMWMYNEDGGERADLSYADLRYADLHGANMHYANLSDANLRGADLRYADLSYANLSYADLRDANLHGANMHGANMHYANLSDANMSGADLHRANLGFNAYFAGCTGQPVYQASCGFGSRNATLTLFAMGEEVEWLFFTGCFKGSFESLIAAIAEKHKGEEQVKYMIAVNYLMAIARANVKGDPADEQV